MSFENLDTISTTVSDLDMASVEWTPVKDAPILPNTFYCEDLTALVRGVRTRFCRLYYQDDGMRAAEFVPTVGFGSNGGLPIITVLHDVEYLKTIMVLFMANGMCCGVQVQ